MNPDLHLLQPYPFEKLKKLHTGLVPPHSLKAINLSLGEPQHPAPELIINAMSATLASGLGKYPTTQGSYPLRYSIAHWLEWRFQLFPGSIDPDKHVLPVNGTREALFAFAQSVIHRQIPQPFVVMPNPFYQIYEGATLLAGARPWFVNGLEETNFLPNFEEVPKDVWEKCQLLYLCSPNNPSGTVMEMSALQRLIALADEYQFIIAADECYAELYADEAHPPVGLLQACMALGRTNFKRCIVFHSLSKRSNVPGLRSGFVAGDAEIIQSFLHYRTYHGCAMPLATQSASTIAWQDETHVQLNRQYYRQKYDAVLDILVPVMEVTRPPASFYLWPKTPTSGEQFTKKLYTQQHVIVLPGNFLSRPAQGVDPGQNRIRIALVASIEECIEAAQRIRTFIESL